MKRRWLPILAASLVLAGAIVLAPAGAPPASAGVRPSSEGASPPAAAATDAARAQATRQEVPPAAGGTSASCLGFAEYLEQLVRLGVAMSRVVETGDRARTPELQQTDARCREVLAELERCVTAPEEHALHELVGLVTPPGEGGDAAPAPDDLAARVRQRTCMLLVRRGLERRLERHRHGAGRGPLDQFVASMLRCLPVDARLAKELGKGCLVDAPYLGLAHEAAVLDLVDRAREQQFLAEVAPALLRTLWHNLAEEHVRTPGELATLALLFKEDENQSRRLAALRHLLSAQGGRYREVVLQEVLSRRDADLARMLGQAAVQDLPPPDALAVLERVSWLSPAGMIGPFLAVAQRAPELVRQAYEQRLADGTAAGLRGDLITAAAFTGDSESVRLAQVAFAQDPSQEVRARAMLALTAQAGAALGEQTLMAALDDEAFSREPARLGQVVLALENLADDANVVDRVAQRLAKRAELLPEDRRRLERLVARAVPGPGK